MGEEDEALMHCELSLLHKATVLLIIGTVCTVIVGEIVLRIKKSRDSSEQPSSKTDGINKVILNLLFGLRTLSMVNMASRRRYAKQRRRVFSDFRKLHEKSTEAHNLELLVCCAEMGLGDEDFASLCRIVNQFETSIHYGDTFARDLCLLNSLGTTALADSFRDSVEPGLVSTFKTYLRQFQFTQEVEKLLNRHAKYYLLSQWILCIAKIVLYFLDMAKDIILITVIANLVSLDAEHIHLFSFQLEFLLIASLVTVELLNMLVLLFNSDLNLYPLPKGLLCIMFPTIAPAALYNVTRLKMEREAKHPQARELMESLDAELVELSFQTLEQEKLRRSWKNLLAHCRQNEATFEHLVQGFILLVLSCMRLTETGTVEGLEHLFTPRNKYLMYVSAAWSILTIIRMNVTLDSLKKDNFQPFVGFCFSLALYSLSYCSTIGASLFFFAPSLGLFNLLEHFKMGNKTASSTTFYDVVSNSTHHRIILMQEVWQPLTSYEDITHFSLRSHYIAFACGIILHILVVALVKFLLWKLLLKSKEDNILMRILHALSLFGKSVPFQDLTRTLPLKSTRNDMRKALMAIKLEFLAVLGILVVENIVLCIPVWIAWYNINVRTQYLEEYFPPLESEKRAHSFIQLIGISLPAMHILFGIGQWFLFKLYLTKGHPWARIWSVISQFDGAPNDDVEGYEMVNLSGGKTQHQNSDQQSQEGGKAGIFSTSIGALKSTIFSDSNLYIDQLFKPSHL